MRKLFTLLAAVVLLFGQLAAQSNRTITGKVTDDKGSPLAGVTVAAVGSDKKALTDEAGSFTISVSDKVKSLRFSSVGFVLQDMNIVGKSSVAIKLATDENALAEVVVVGYGTKSAREVTGSVGKIDGAKIANEPVSSFNQALQGKTAGVQVNLSTGLLADRTAIRVRGVNSITSSSQPLIVIDGVPSYSGNLNGFNSGNGTRFDPLALVNSADIESIEILKDAGAAAIYGSRGSNGVILITTKKGKKGVVRVSVDSKVSWSKASNLPELLNGDEFNTINNEKAFNRFSVSNPAAVAPAKNSDIDGDGVVDRTDWNSLLYRTGLMTDNTVSFQGGADKMTIYGSLRYLNQEGIVFANKLKSGQARINIELTPKTWFKGGLQMSYVKSLNNGVLSDTYIVGTTVSGWMAPPTVSAYNPTMIHGFNLNPASGLLSLGNNTPVAGSTSLLPSTAYYYNTRAALEMNRNDNTAQDLRTNIYGEIQPIKGLKVKTQFGVINLINFEDQFTSPFQAGLGLPYGGLVQDQQSNYSTWNWQNYANYDKVIAGKHKISATVGTEYQKRRFTQFYIGAANFADPFFKDIIGGAYTQTQPGSTVTLDLTGGDQSSNAFMSYFARASYSFAGKYFIEGSFRRDGSSVFGAKHEFGNFPGVSAGWEVTKEKFMNVNWLNYLKVRASWGRVGSSGIADYAARGLYSGASYTSLNGLGISRIANAGLQWESADKTNFGFDATVLKNKLSVTVEYFNNNINHLLFNAPVLYTTGVPGATVQANIGRMTNKGWEFTANATPVTRGKFSWNVNFNFTTIKNNITELVAISGNTDYVQANQVASIGRPMGVYKLYEWAGVNPANGNPMWYDANNNIKQWDFATQSWKDDKGVATTALSSVTDTKYQEGKTGLPKWYGGFDNTFTYGQVDLGITTTYAGGFYIYNQTLASMLNNNFSNNFAVVKDRWTTAGQVTNIPRLYQNDNTANQASTRFLEKGDYIRVRTITLGYTFSRKMLTKAGFERLRVYAQLYNPFTFTKYSGLDPEVNYNSFNNVAIGTDNRATPNAKTTTIGLSVSF
jgi:TonB-dependent starch-binding outer membrane protein SusC